MGLGERDLAGQLLGGVRLELGIPHGVQAAWHMGSLGGEPGQGGGIEADGGHLAAIMIEVVRHPAGQGIGVRPGLQFHQQHRAPSHQLQHLGQGRDAVGAVQQRDVGQGGPGLVGDGLVQPRQALQRLVVKDDHLAIQGEADIEFDAEVAAAGQLERRQAVFHGFARTPQPAMGEGRLDQAVR